MFIVGSVIGCSGGDDGAKDTAPFAKNVQKDGKPKGVARPAPMGGGGGASQSPTAQ